MKCKRCEETKEESPTHVVYDGRTVMTMGCSVDYATHLSLTVVESGLCYKCAWTTVEATMEARQEAKA